MRVTHKCPSCSGDVIVDKTINTDRNPNKVEKLQRLKCRSCGLVGVALTTTIIEWKTPPT